MLLIEMLFTLLLKNY